MATSPLDLTTVANFKLYHGISSSATDTQIQLIITYISAYIQKLCNRTFAQGTYVEFQNTNIGSNRLQVKNKPIIGVAAVKWGFYGAITANYSGSAISATIQTTTTSIIVFTRAANGTPTTTTLLFATYPTLSTMAAAISGVAGFTATITADGDVRYLIPTAGQALVSYGTNVQVQLAYPNFDLAYAVDYENSVISYEPLSSLDYAFPNSRNAGGCDQAALSFPTMFQGLLIDYTGGYATIPPDVEGVALELIAQTFDRATADTSLQSEKLNDYSYSRFAPAQMEEFARMRLGAYLPAARFGGGLG